MRYIAFLRGVNVGGKSLLSMPMLRDALEKSGLEDVRTYINSGNVFFTHKEANEEDLSLHIHEIINKEFKIDSGVVVFSKSAWEKIIQSAPGWWGKDESMKHNILIMLRPYDMPSVVEAIGVLKPDIEHMTPGDGVLYQAMSLKLFGRTTTGKLAKSPVYKQMTIRNYNTATKILALF
jgi:uncharacterized protein (DUF1697 family)